MFGHEDVRAAIAAHLAAALPAELGRVRARRNVELPPDPKAYLLADTLAATSKYPVVMIRSTDMEDTVDVGEGHWHTRYRVEVVTAVEVPTAGAYSAASVERDRLSEAVRAVLLHRGPSLAPEVNISSSTLTEAHGPAAETLQGRPLAVSATTFAVFVAEYLPEPDGGAEPIDPGAVSTSLASQPETI